MRLRLSLWHVAFVKALKQRDRASWAHAGSDPNLKWVPASCCFTRADKPSAGQAKGTELTQSLYLTVMHSDNYRSSCRETREDILGGEPPVVVEAGVFTEEGALLFVGS